MPESLKDISLENLQLLFITQTEKFIAALESGATSDELAKIGNDVKAALKMLEEKNLNSGGDKKGK